MLCVWIEANSRDWRLAVSSTRDPRRKQQHENPVASDQPIVEWTENFACRTKERTSCGNRVSFHLKCDNFYHITLSSRSLTEQLKAKDEKIVELQKEIYEIKIANIESLKKELQDKLSNLAWSQPCNIQIFLTFTQSKVYLVAFELYKILYKNKVNKVLHQSTDCVHFISRSVYLSLTKV